MIKPTFAKVASHYRTSPSSVHSCSMNFPNTCAIRMSEALVKADNRFLSAFKSSSRNTCPHGFMRGAQDLASVLSKSKVFGTRTMGWSAQEDRRAPSEIQGKKGVICYMNIPGYSGQGHIDLWKGDMPVGSEYWDAETIWFWELP